MKYLNMAKKHGSKIALGSAAFISSSAFADDAIGTAISAAVEAGKANYTLVVIGLITLSALAFGLGRITGSMK
ncbi:hypothetical protein TW84_17845 [Vibrio neptunius]|uniref:hypothetical protein n=1 Tax=Vibrio neptunius TaxID=170651 RepID=UPI0005FA8B74|nr:hypothetical protein [Vibrio neptunius]KJY87356.1 hypothetical protein TW84_17845 [Vibrio neptunius]